MVDQVPDNSPATAEDWDIAEKSALSALADGGMANAQSIKATKDRFNIYRQQTTFTKDQVKAINELFLNKKKYADLLATNAASVGQLGGQTEIQLQDKAKSAEISTSQLTQSTNLEILGSANKQKMAWATTCELFGKFCMAVGATDFGTKVLAYAESCKPADILDKAYIAPLVAQRQNVKIDVDRPTATALSVLDRVMEMTNPDKVGMGASSGAQVREQMEAVKGSSVPQKSPIDSATTPLSAVNINQMAKDLTAKGLSEKAASDVAALINRADRNHDGHLSSSEKPTVEQDKVFTALSEKDRKSVQALEVVLH